MTGPASTLLRYVIIAAMLTAIGIVYLWQVNSLSTLHDETLALQRETHELEQDNWLLADQLARWSSPDHVDAVSVAQGYVAAPITTVAQPAVLAPAAESRQVAATSAGQ